MEGRTEYIVRFKGDYSALAKDLNKIGAATKKLEDDEVIIKLAYDGNIKEFNKTFDKISKLHPELGIQFQYNVNEKLLNQETDKLKKLTDLKLDIDENKVKTKLEGLKNNIEVALNQGMSKDEITKRVNEYFGYFNTAIKAGAKNINQTDFNELTDQLFGSFEKQSREIQDILNTIWQDNQDKRIELFHIDKGLNDDISTAQDRVNDLNDAMEKLEKQGASKLGLPSEAKKLEDEIKILKSDIEDMQGQLQNLSGEKFEEITEQVRNLNDELSRVLSKLGMLNNSALKDISTFLTSFGKTKPGEIDKYIERIKKSFDSLDEKTKTLLKDLGLLNSEGGITPITDGANNLGGLIGEKNTVKVSHSTTTSIENVRKLKEVLDEAYASGVNCVRIIDAVESGENTVIELQTTMKGNVLQDSNFNFDVNALKASDEQLQKLYLDMKKLWDLGIAVDINPSNFVYDTIKGFGLFDLDFKDVGTYLYEGFDNGTIPKEDDEIKTLWQDFLYQIKENIDEETDEGKLVGSFYSKLTNAISKVKDAAQDATKEAAEEIRKSQDSNSPAELTKPLGKDFGEGYAEGIREAMPDIIKACREIVLGAYNAIKEISASDDEELKANTSGFSESFINIFRTKLEESIPTIQEEIKGIFSKINIADGNEELFKHLGEGIIEPIVEGLRNANSGESFAKALESIINDAFSKVVLNIAAQSLVNEIQNYLDLITEQKPFHISHFDVDSNSLVVSIQNALNESTFNIDLGGTIKDISTALNTSAENVRLSFIDVIKWIREANELQKKNDAETDERAFFYNTKTGEFSNPTVVGDVGKVKNEVKKSLLKSEIEKGKSFDTDAHWHSDWDIATPSPADIVVTFERAYEEGITKFVVGAQKEISEIDVSKIANDRDELVNKAKDFLKQNSQSILSLFDDYLKGTEDTLDVKKLTPYFTKSLSKVDALKPDEILTIYGKYVGALFQLEWQQTKDSVKAIAIAAKRSEWEQGDQKYNTRAIKAKSSDIIKEIKGFSNKTDKGEYSLYNTDILNNLDEKIRPLGERFVRDYVKNLVSSMEMAFNNQDLLSSKDVDYLVLKNFKNTLSDKNIYDTLQDNDKFDVFQNAILQYVQDNINEMLITVTTQLTKKQNNEAFQVAGRQALNRIAKDTLLGDSVSVYTHEEFEQKYGANLPKGEIDKSTQLPFTPTLSNDFKQQLQDLINASGKYLVNVYGELVDNFKTELQEMILQTGVYDIDISGILSKTFRDDTQQKIKEQGEYTVDINGKPVETFKEELEKSFTEIFSTLNLNEQMASLFGDMGQKLVNAIIEGIQNESSQESLKQTLEIIITNAFKDMVINSAVRELINKIQQAINYYTESTPLHIDYFDPNTDNLVVSIQDALNKKTFNVNLGGTIQELATTLNTSADNIRLTFIDAIKWMKDANDLQVLNEEETRERQLFFNTKTGQFSNPVLIGDTHSVKGELSRSLLANEMSQGKTFDTDLHWHQDFLSAAPSPQDLLFDFVKAYEDGITKFVVGAQNELTEIDFSKIAKNSQELTEKARNFLSNNIESVKVELENFIDRNGLEEGITYYDTESVDGIISDTDANVRRLYGQYLKAILDSEWEKIQKDFIEKAQKEKYDDYTGNASFFDFTLLQLNKNKIGDAIGNLGLTDIFGESKYTEALSKEISSRLDFSDFSNKFFVSLMTNVRKGIDYTSFDGSLQSIKDVVEETFENTVDSEFQEILGNKFGKFKEFTIQYATEFIDNLFTDIQTKLTKGEENEAYQQAGQQALKNIAQKTLLNGALSIYSHDEFEEKYGKGIISQTTTPISQLGIQPTIPEDFLKQLQTIIDDSGKYVIKVYGELVEDFKNQIQSAIDKLGLFTAKIEGFPYSDFHDGLQTTIDFLGNYHVNIEGQLISTFKEVLQQLIDELGVFTIQVTPDTAKSEEIKKVDSSTNNQNLVSIDDTIAKIKELGLRTQQAEDAISLLKGGKETFLWLDEEGNDGYEAIDRLVELFKELGIAIKVIEDSEGWSTTITTSPLQESPEDIEATTKAYISKKDAVQQLREQLNLTKKAAEELVDVNYQPMDNGKFKIDQESLNQLIASKKESSTVEGSATTTTTALSQENELFKKIAKSAQNAADAKKNFAEANEKVLQSIVNSLVGLNSEGDGFNNLNKLIGNLANNKEDRITNMVKNLKELRDLLNGQVNSDSIISTLKDMAAQGENLKELAKVLSAGKKAIDSAKDATKSGGKTKKDSSSSIKKEVKSAEKDLSKLGKRVGKLGNQELTDQFNSIKTALKDVGDDADKLKAVNESIADLTAKTTKAETETDNLAKDAKRLTENYKELKSLQNQLNGSKEDGKKAEEIQKRIDALKAENKALENNKYTKEQQQAIDKAQSDLNIAIADTEDKKAEATRKSEEATKKAEEAEKRAMIAHENRRNALLLQASELLKNGKISANYGIEIKKMIGELSDTEIADRRLGEIANRFKEIKTQANLAGKSGKTLFQMIKGRATSLVSYLGTFASFYRIISYVRTAFTTIKELDTQLVDLRKTTTMTTTELNQFYNASSDIAKQLGVTTSEIISQAAAWSRLGYSSKEAATEMAQISSKFASISPGMTTDNATDYLVSTMQAYGIAVDEVERKVLDNVNKIGNTFATTNAEIGEMLTRSSAAMKAANNSLEETIALESAAVQITRNAETTGTAFRTKNCPYVQQCA